MPRGGARPGAGRKTKAVRDAIDACEAAARKPQNKDLTPLDYMLAVMRDEEQDVKLRLAMAQAAAPYVHPRAGEIAKGKKEERRERAEAAASKFAAPSPPRLVASNGR